MKGKKGVIRTSVMAATLITGLMQHSSVLALVTEFIYVGDRPHGKEGEIEREKGIFKCKENQSKRMKNGDARD